MFLWMMQEPRVLFSVVYGFPYRPMELTRVTYKISLLCPWNEGEAYILKILELLFRRYY